MSARTSSPFLQTLSIAGVAAVCALMAYVMLKPGSPVRGIETANGTAGNLISWGVIAGLFFLAVVVPIIYLYYK